MSNTEEKDASLQAVADQNAVAAIATIDAPPATTAPAKDDTFIGKAIGHLRALELFGEEELKHIEHAFRKYF